MIKIDENAITRKGNINVGFLYKNAKTICKLTLLTEKNDFDKILFVFSVFGKKIIKRSFTYSRHPNRNCFFNSIKTANLYSYFGTSQLPRYSLDTSQIVYGQCMDSVWIVYEQCRKNASLPLANFQTLAKVKQSYLYS